MLFITTVIYNKSIFDLPSREIVMDFVTKHGRDAVRYIIVDNSDETFLNDRTEEYEELISKEELIYIKNGGNLGLAKAYNKALKYAEEKSPDIKKDFMLFLDDDTTIPSQYLSKVYEACDDASGNDTPNVITGLIKTDSRYLSPMKGFRFIFHDKDYITGPGLYNDITFINSGMTVRLDSLIKSGGFNEELFLDMIDFTLAYELSERGLCSVQVLDETIIQSFSGRNASDKSTLLKRFEIYKKDFKNYCRITRRSSAFCTFALLKRRLMIEFKAK